VITCPHCHFPLTPARAVVTAATVLDIRDVWMQDNAEALVTVEIPFVYIQGSSSTRVVQPAGNRSYAEPSLHDPLEKYPSQR